MREEFRANYYALLIAVAKGKTARQSLMAMGICPDNDCKGEKKNETDCM